jgi:hypothetical protein
VTPTTSRSSTITRDEPDGPDPPRSHPAARTRGPRHVCQPAGAGASRPLGPDHLDPEPASARSADTALRLARHPGTSTRFWMNLQTRYDLAVAARNHGARIAAEVTRVA